MRQTLAGAFDVLTATLLHRVSHFEASRNPNIVPLSGAALPNADADAPSPLCQSILGSVIGMSRSAIKAREHNVELFNEGTLQDLVSKGVPGGGTGKKAEIRARKQAKDADQRDRTIAKLKRRQEEREQKIARKETKKRELEETLAPFAQSVPTPKAQSHTLPPADVARQLFADAEDSRYSIASPAPTSRVSKTQDKVMFVDDSDEDNSSDSHDDADVEIGGGLGGDLVAKKSKAAKPGPDVILLGDEYDEEEQSDSSDGSGEFAVQSLRPAAAAATSTGGDTKAEKKAKSDARSAFWASKGSKREVETITIDSD